MGQIYICKNIITLINVIEQPAQYIYPFNRGVQSGKYITFNTDGQDVAYNDRIVFSDADDCSKINTTSVV